MVRPRELAPGRFIQIRDEDLPDWVRDVPPPDGLDRAAFFSRARFSLPFGGRWDDYLDRLAARCVEVVRERGGNPFPALQLLDLVHWYLLRPDRSAWFAEMLNRIFAERAYTLFQRLDETLPRHVSDSDQTVLYLYRLLLPHPFPTKVARLRAIGRAFNPPKDPAAVRMAIRRAEQAPAWRSLFPSGRAAAQIPKAEEEAGTAVVPEEDVAPCICDAPVFWGGVDTFTRLHDLDPAQPPATFQEGSLEYLLQEDKVLVRKTAGPPLPHFHCRICQLAVPLDDLFLERVVLVGQPEAPAGSRNYGFICRSSSCREQLVGLSLAEPPAWRWELAELGFSTADQPMQNEEADEEDNRGGPSIAE